MRECCYDTCTLIGSRKYSFFAHILLVVDEGHDKGKERQHNETAQEYVDERQLTHDLGEMD